MIPMPPIVYCSVATMVMTVVVVSAAAATFPALKASVVVAD